MFRILLALMMGLTFIQAARAQSDAIASAPDSALLDALLKIEGEPLGLDYVIDQALLHSTQAQGAKAALSSARGALTRERGVFDPELFADVRKSSEHQPSSSPFSGAAVVKPKTTAGEAGARMKLPIGTELQASITGRKLETNSGFASLSPEYNSTGSLTIRQPLLQGFGPAGWGDFSQAKLAYDATKLRYEDAVAGVKATAESAYWDLYAAERDLAVAMVTRDLATALLNEANVRSSAGLVGPNQVNSAKVFLSEQELSYLDAQDNFAQTGDAMGSLIGKRPDGSQRLYRTLDEPKFSGAVDSEEATVNRAMQTNPELKASRLDTKAMSALVKAAKWNALPKADVFAAFGGNGLGGTGRDVIFGSDTIRNSLDTKFSDALDQALQRDYPTWTIGLRLSMPILLREKGGDRDRIKADAARVEQRYVQTKRTLEERVRAVHREVEKGRERLELSQQGVQASLDQVRIGLIEYRNGVATAFELVRLGADLANAQRRHSQTLARTAKAEAMLKQLAPMNSNE